MRNRFQALRGRGVENPAPPGVPVFFNLIFVPTGDNLFDTFRISWSEVSDQDNPFFRTTPQYIEVKQSGVYMFNYKLQVDANGSIAGTTNFYLEFEMDYDLIHFEQNSIVRPDNNLDTISKSFTGVFTVEMKRSQRFISSVQTTQLTSSDTLTLMNSHLTVTKF